MNQTSSSDDKSGKSIDKNIDKSGLMPLFDVSLLAEKAERALTSLKSVLSKPPTMMGLKQISGHISDLTEYRRELGILISMSSNKTEAQAASGKIYQRLNTIYFTPSTYKYFHHVWSTDPTIQKKPDQMHFMKQEMYALRHKGLHLSAELQKQIQEITSKINQLANAYEDALKSSWSITLDQKQIDKLKSIGFDELDDYRSDSGDIIIDQVNSIDFLTDCPDPDLRRLVHRNSSNHGHPENLKRIRELVKLRTQYARLVNHDNYAKLQMSTLMVHEPDQIRTFLRDLWHRIIDQARADVKLLSTTYDVGLPMRYSDYAYYKNRYIIDHHKVDLIDLADHLHLSSVLPVILKQYRKILGLKFKARQVDLWTKDLTEIHVRQDGEMLGRIICDWFPREGKAGGFSCYGVKTGDGDGLAVLHCNVPTDRQLSIYHVKSLFHEFGHAVHHLLGTSEFRTLSGFETTIDFVEMPSQIMEELVWKKDVLKEMTEGALSDQTIDNILSTRHQFVCVSTLMQICYSLTSLNIYDVPANATAGRDPYQSTTKYFNSMNVGLIIGDDEFNIESNFTHLMYYASTYYSYLWSRVYAYDIFDQLDSNGLKYRDKILKRGGSLSPMLYLVDFLGRTPSMEPFMKRMNSRSSPVDR